MSSGLYSSILKDREQLDRSNPRIRTTSGLSSADADYKNYLSAVKPRAKPSSFGGNIDVKIARPSSFVDSAVKSSQKTKDTGKSYTAPSAQPINRTVESSTNQKLQPNGEISSDSCGSVHTLRHMFDKPTENGTVRNFNRDNNAKKASKILNVNSLLAEDTTAEANEDDKTETSEVKKETLTKKLSSEFDNFEDRIVPTGTKKIDISSILAPVENENEEKKESIVNGESQEDVSPKQKFVDFQKEMEVARLRQTEQEVAIEKRFNIKRRSLKDRLNDLVSEDENFLGESVEAEPNKDFSADNVVPAVSSGNKVSSKKREEDQKLPNHVTSNENFLGASTETGPSRNVLAENALPSVSSTVNISPKIEEQIKKSPSQVIGSINEPVASASDPGNRSNETRYKSAVERFNEFLNKEHLDDDLTKISDTDLEASSLDREEIGIRGRVFELQGSDDLKTSTETDTAGSTLEVEADSSTLMDSILKHMEKSNSFEKPELSLLRSSSLSESAETGRVFSEMEPPDVMPRRSKMQPNPQLENGSVEELIESKKEEEVEAQPDRDLEEPSEISEGDGYSSEETESQTESDEESDSQDEYSLNNEVESLPPLKSCIANKGQKIKRKVNFHAKIQDVILTYGPSEYDRANADIDPIASSAEWELEKRVDNMDVFSVDLHKDERGLGLSIIGLGVGTETGVEKLGIFVKTLTDNGAAQKDGRIQVNDQILEVNGVSLVGVTQYFAAQTLKATNGVVRFLMGREKSRRTMFAPGSPLIENPEMQKHIEEMKQTLQQMEEYEERAIDAEKTLEEVKRELLAAEERAHETEQQLKETKEQLKLASESPFVNGQRKMKNEIKKKGGKADKLDELQRSLKDMTKRLSLSEENLLELETDKNTKEKEIEMLQKKANQYRQQQYALQSSNESLKQDIEQKVVEVGVLITKNQELSAKLEILLKNHEKERDDWKKKEVELNNTVEIEKKNAEKTLSELLEKQQFLEKELDEEKKKTFDDVVHKEALKKKFDLVSAKLEIDKDELREKDKLIEDQTVQLRQLKDKSEYLESLIVKYDVTESQAVKEVRRIHDEKEEEYKKEREELMKKVLRLEEHFKDCNLAESEISVNNAKDNPPVPQRKFVDPVSIIDVAIAPEVTRSNKPTRKSGSNTSSESLKLEDTGKPLEDIAFDEPIQLTSETVVESEPIFDLDLENTELEFKNPEGDSNNSESDDTNLELDTESPNLIEAGYVNIGSTHDEALESAVIQEHLQVDPTTRVSFHEFSLDDSDDPEEYFIEIKKPDSPSGAEQISQVEVAQVETEAPVFETAPTVSEAPVLETTPIVFPSSTEISTSTKADLSDNIDDKTFDNSQIRDGAAKVAVDFPNIKGDIRVTNDLVVTKPAVSTDIAEVEPLVKPQSDSDKSVIGTIPEGELGIEGEKTVPISKLEGSNMDEEGLRKYIEPIDENSFNRLSRFSLDVELDDNLDLVGVKDEPASEEVSKEVSLNNSDEGTFDIVVEDVQDEIATPISSLKHVDKSKIGAQMSSEDDLNGEPEDSLRRGSYAQWLGDDWKRLNSREKDHQADMLAEKISAESPIKRRGSILSSSSSDNDDDERELEAKLEEQIADKVEEVLEPVVDNVKTEHPDVIITDSIPERENWDRSLSIKIDSSYFQKSALEESFEGGISILDESGDVDVSDLQQGNFDAIPETLVLDNRLQHAKRDLGKQGKKRKPTHGIHGSLADGLDKVIEVETLAESKKQTFFSTPNLLNNSTRDTAMDPNLENRENIARSNSVSVDDKPEKKFKQKLGSYLPKVFKKSKGYKKSFGDGDMRSSTGSNKSNKSKASAGIAYHSSQTDLDLNTDKPVSYDGSPLITDGEVVPIDEKAKALNQQLENDAATDEAVVPFADKEELMSSTQSLNRENPSPVSTPIITVHTPKPPNPLLAELSAKINGAEDDNENVIPNDDLVPSPTESPTEKESPYIAGRLESDASDTSGYNERGVDVGNFDEVIDEAEMKKRTNPSSWTVRQVGLWLVEVSLDQYVDGFSSHNVDGQTLLRADGNRLKEYGVANSEHRAEIKKHIKDFRNKLGKDSISKGKSKDYKSAKDKLQFWKGKYKVIQ